MNENYLLDKIPWETNYRPRMDSLKAMPDIPSRVRLVSDEELTRVLDEFCENAYRRQKELENKNNI